VDLALKVAESLAGFVVAPTAPGPTRLESSLTLLPHISQPRTFALEPPTFATWMNVCFKLASKSVCSLLQLPDLMLTASFVTLGAPTMIMPIGTSQQQ
jgi:hypothetical protein